MTTTTDLGADRTATRTDIPPAAPSRWRRWAVPTLIAVIAIFAAGVWWQVLDSRNEVSRTLEARVAAESIVVDLLTYRHESVAEEMDEALNNVTGSFADDYRALVTDMIVPVSRERQLSTDAVVVQSGIVDTSSEDVTFLLFVDQASTSADAPGTRRDVSRIEVTVRNIDGQWKITRLDAV